MSIASAITAAQGKVANAYTAVSNKGGTLPATQDLSNLPTAINSIPTGSSPTINSLSVTPTTSAQTFNESGVDGYKPVSVAAVTAAIDANIAAGNIKSGVTILGVAGSVTELNGSTKTVTPTTSQQTVTPTSPSNGLTSVTVNAVTSSIDANITAGNIKKDVTILGVTGTHEGSGGGGGYTPLFEVNCVVYTSGYVENFTFTSVRCKGNTYRGIALKPFATSFLNDPRNSIYNLLNTSTGEDYNTYFGPEGSATSAMQQATFPGTISFLNLPNVKNFYAQSLFMNNTSLTKVNLHNATSVILTNCFAGCSSLTDIDLSSVEEVPAQAFTGSAAQGGAFANTAITTLSFPALKTTSFGGNGAFRYMLKGVNGCTIHFPSNLQTTVSGLTDYPNFSGTNTVLAFDLPATS